MVYTIYIDLEYLKLAVEGLHKCIATFKEKVNVTETFEWELVLEGVVFVFDLAGHSKVKISYAWSSPIPQSDQQRIYAVLHQGPVKSAQDAVRASIASDYEKEEPK